LAGSSLPLIGPEPALGISAQAARGVNRDWMSKKHGVYWQSTCGQLEAKGFLKRPSAEQAGELLSLSRNQLKIKTRLLTGHCHLKGYTFKLWLVDSSGCDSYKQASETALHIVCDCEALAVLRFSYLGHYFLKTADFTNTSTMCSQCGAAECLSKELHKRSGWSRCKGHCGACPNVLYPTVYYLRATHVPELKSTITTGTNYNIGISFTPCHIKETIRPLCTCNFHQTIIWDHL
jgi:hypothetical protein